MSAGNVEVPEFRGHISPEAQESAERNGNGSPSEAADILARAIAEPRAARALWLMLLEPYRPG
jgi:hypothetical protein